MIGVTVENEANKNRLYDLLDVGARTRWVSAEPLLERLDLTAFLGPDDVNWIAAGPEIGANARPCRAAWIRSLLHQARGAQIPFFTKHVLDGRTIRERPA
jgi:protein gp37